MHGATKQHAAVTYTVNEQLLSVIIQINYKLSDCHCSYRSQQIAPSTSLQHVNFDTFCLV